jgi:hypothetical protein
MISSSDKVASYESARASEPRRVEDGLASGRGDQSEERIGPLTAQRQAHQSTLTKLYQKRVRMSRTKHEL